MNTDNETIYALATPAGRSALAVVRVSGPRAFDGLKALCGRDDFAPREAKLCRLRDNKSQAIIDEALVLYFAAPRSYTGEESVEYHLHGGVAVVNAMLDALGALDGHRLAEPGEFTRRAFEHGKMDLTEAEAVADLIDAETQMQAAQALDQLGGALGDLYQGWTDTLKADLAHLEAEIEFPDEDLPDTILTDLRPKIQALRGDITAHLDDNNRGERLRDGLKIAIIGAPNAGKSSLINLLARRNVAIVSDQAGTTRDVIDVHLNIGGYPVIVSDTAGLRPDQISNEGQDAIEQEGIRRALRAANDADLRILLFDATDLPTFDAHTLALRAQNDVFVLNKVDGDIALPADIDGHDFSAISVKNERGIDGLLAALQTKIIDMVGKREQPSLTRKRHRHALERGVEALDRAMNAPLPELAAEDLRLAIRELGRITGRVDVEDLLDVIFNDFCIGK